MNICIMTEGGSRMGLGHLSRCLALAQAMKRLKKKAKIRFIVNGDKAAKSFLQKCGVKPVISDWIKDKKKTISHSKASKVIIIDSYRAPSSFYSSLAHLKPRPRLVAIDDYHRLDYETDMVINPSVHGQDRYIILRKEFHAAKAKRVREHIKDVLITFGGTISYFHFAKRLISMLIKKFPDFNYHILMRSGSLLSKSNSALTDKARIKVYSNLTAARLRDLMLKMDLCISGGGQTLYELARCGVPTIGVCFANNQILNLTSMRKRGFLCYAGYYKSEEIFENICKYIKVLSVKKNRVAAGKIGREIVDGMGADRLARTILEEVPPRVSVRRAAPGDCRDIWRWRNSSQVRRISFDRAAIPYENHKEWFEKKLKDEFTEIYIGENDEKKIGQARFDLDVEEPTAHINVNLNPAFFNKGFGNRLIKFATEEFLRKNPQRTVIAEVLDDNIVSKKAFSKAGYQFCYNTVKGGRDISIFKFNAKETRVSK